MKKILGAIGIASICGLAIAIDGFVLKNTGNSTVYSVTYESGKATNTIDGVIVADAVISTASSASVLTSNGSLTLTGSLMPISAAAAATNVSIAAVSSAKVGQAITIINTGTNAITLVDAAPAYLSADIALGQYDSLTLVVQATNVIVQTATSNN